MHDKGVTSDRDAAIAAAIPVFARRGFADAKLDEIAKQSGVSKRMLHYHFSDKRGLYLSSLAAALSHTAPADEVLNRSYAVPVEGMRRFVDVMFHGFLEHPDCVRLLLRENLDAVLALEEFGSDHRDNDVTLHAERLLMLGQDAGAFRPGICAEDLLTLIVSLCEFQVAHARTSYAVSRVDFADRRNVDGMRRLVVDAVLAFLTSNIPPSGYDSYLVSSAESKVAAADIY